MEFYHLFFLSKRRKNKETGGIEMELMLRTYLPNIKKKIAGHIIH